MHLGATEIYEIMGQAFMTLVKEITDENIILAAGNIANSPLAWLAQLLVWEAIRVLDNVSSRSEIT